jgi:hypothetical protein
MIQKSPKLATTFFLLASEVSHAAIYQWEYINPALLPPTVLPKLARHVLYPPVEPLVLRQTT